MVIFVIHPSYLVVSRKVGKFATVFQRIVKMERVKQLAGLTAKQVELSRKLHGINVLTPPKKTTVWQQLLSVCSHWIAISIGFLLALSIVFAIVCNGSLGGSVWIVPLVMTISWLLVLLVGFFGGFSDPLFKILIAAFVLSMGISIYEYVDEDATFGVFLEPIGIIVALLLATGVAYVLERSNERTFQSLNEVDNDTMVKVIRDGNVTQVARRDIVVGDIIILDTGEEVPADALLLDALGLIVDESTLTGEPQARKTTVEKHFDTEATYPSNKIMKGTTIMEGYCTAEVVAVGDKTESGKVFEAAQVSREGTTPLSQKLNSLAHLITKASYIVSALVVVGRLIVFFSTDTNIDFTSTNDLLRLLSYMLQTIMIAVTLIVVAVPEGLPMSITLSLAFSMRKLMRQNTLPRTIHACETMGAAQVICTDKTGTLTQNKMQVVDSCIENVDEQIVYEMIATNSTANLDLSEPTDPKPIGNPTEAALLLWIYGKGADYSVTRSENEVKDRLPFSTANKYMATVVRSKAVGKTIVYVKGAPEIILNMSSIEPQKRNLYEQKLHQYQTKAMRTLAFAYALVNDSDTVFSEGKLQTGGLHFVGIVAISDPVRDDVAAAIKECVNAGIQVKIVTGDNSDTAMEIGRQIGLWNNLDSNGEALLTGTQFASMSDEQLSEKIDKLKILSRARPNDKERLVRLLRRKQLVVAATGDGTNDAPALNAANVGLSMGDGTAVAKEASDMTIQDNSFSTIAKAVMWGRSLYKNIQRFILFQMTVNVSACLIVLVGAFTGTQSPLTVTQMLWVNLIMDTFAAIALASLPPTTDVMREKPRNMGESIINKPMATNILATGSILSALLLCLLWVMQHANINSLWDITTANIGIYDGLTRYELSLFFTIFVMMQFWNMFNAKAFMTNKSAFNEIGKCKGFMAIVVVILIGQVIIVEVGGSMFNIEPLKIYDLIGIIVATSPILWLREMLRGRITHSEST